jgi:hypothetical protein
MKPMALTKGIVLPGERRMTGGRSLNGGVWLDIDGRGRIELSPQQGLELATGMLRALGINVEFDAPQ